MIVFSPFSQLTIPLYLPPLKARVFQVGVCAEAFKEYSTDCIPVPVSLAVTSIGMLAEPYQTFPSIVALVTVLEIS